MKKTIFIILFSMLFQTTAQPLSFSKSELDAFHTGLIARMINAVQPELKNESQRRIAKSLYLTSKKYRISPELMVAIIGTESDFVNEKVSTTGDLSMAQINASIWNKEFARLGLKQLNTKLLKKNETYALNKMGEILNILKTRHAKNDSKWFARYHSHTKKYKNIYTQKVEKRLRMIASVN